MDNDEIRNSFIVQEIFERLESLERDRSKLLDEVKDIMTAFENRVLKEIENLTDARIDPMDKITSGLMLTIADLTSSVSALLDIYSDDAADKDYDFNVRFPTLKSTYYTAMLQDLKDSHDIHKSETSQQDSTSTDSGNP